MCSWPLSAWSSRSAAFLSSLTDLPTTLTTSSRWRFFPNSQNQMFKGTYGRVQATARSSQWAATLCEVQHQHSSSSISCTFLGIFCEVDLKDCFFSRGCSEPSRYSSSCNYLWSSNSRCNMLKHVWFLFISAFLPIFWKRFTNLYKKKGNLNMFAPFLHVTIL